MGTKSKQIQNELRQKVFEAVQQGIITPNAVIDYIVDSGWEYPPPTKPTVIFLLNENGVEYVWGGWEKVR